MICEHSVAAILGVQFEHVAAHAVASRSAGMRLCQRKPALMTRQAARSVILGRLLGLVMWVVARPAPQAPVALARAQAQCELLRVADDFKSLARAAGG